MKIRDLGVEFSKRSEGQTYMTKLLVAYRLFGNALVKLQTEVMSVFVEVRQRCFRKVKCSDV